MVLNEPIDDQDLIDSIIYKNLSDLIYNIKKEKITINRKDIELQLFNRQESLFVRSKIIYPNEHLPNHFGVCRGYAGGGIHLPLQITETMRMSKNRVAKANRILELFKNCFIKILSDIDSASGDLETWERVSI